ncbi:MAG: DUF4105 domain-containing protein [Proteobacteria bacterium]|nr:DUF4105 domain-containing protein [Pseudomonadota bacterium]
MLLSWVFVQSWCQAAAQDNLNAARPRAAFDPAWLRLLHYKKTFTDSYESSIDAASFFLSSDGQKNPAAEWAALAEGLASPSAAQLACRFPARLRLQRQLGSIPWGKLSCPDLEEWKSRLLFHSISLVYSTAYAGNPASIFGHNLLKLNRRESGGDGSSLALLDYGVAFLAQTDPNDGALYVLKGLLGGYPGYYSLQPFYQLLNTYAYSENRDLWEFEIQLDAEQRELLLEHLWELLHEASASYYFTHVNCSAMILELLDAVRPDWNFRAAIKGFVLPQDIMRQVAATTGAGTLHFWPSQRRIFIHRIEQFNELQERQFQAWSYPGVNIALADDAQVLDALIDQVNLSKSKLQKDEQVSLQQYETKLLLARSRLGISQTELSYPKTASNNPLLIHGTSKISAFALQENKQDGVGLRLRYGLHDLLDEASGFDPYYHINFFDLSLQKYSQEKKARWQLQLADLVSIVPYRSAEPIPSWAMAGGWRTVLGYDDKIESWARGAIGTGLELKRDRSLVLLWPDLEISTAALASEQWRAQVGLRLAWYLQWSNAWRHMFEIRPYQNFLQTDRRQGWDLSWEQRWKTYQDLQLELRVAKRESRSLQLGLSRVW